MWDLRFPHDDYEDYCLLQLDAVQYGIILLDLQSVALHDTLDDMW